MTSSSFAISATGAPTSSAVKPLYHEEGSVITDDVAHQKHCHKRIISAATGLSGRCLVLGVGNGLNVPLDRLCAQFERVTIVDSNVALLLQAQETVSAERVSRLALVALDLTGGVIQKWMTQIDGQVSLIRLHCPRYFKDFWKEITGDIKSLSPPPISDEVLIPGSYSLTISMLVASQTVALPIIHLNREIQKVFGGVDYPIPKKSMIKVQRLSSRIWAFQSNNLIRWTKAGGRIVFADAFNQATIRFKEAKVTHNPTLPLLDNKYILGSLFMMDSAPKDEVWKMSDGYDCLPDGSRLVREFGIWCVTFKR